MYKVLATICGLAAILFVTAAVLMAAESARARAEIPFAFQANGTSFEAGTYYFETGVWNGVIAISDTNGKKSLMAVLPAGYPDVPASPQLRFIRNGATYTLSEVWFSSGPSGHRLNAPAPGSRVEIALVRR